jgi:hypothetical protein
MLKFYVKVVWGASKITVPAHTWGQCATKSSGRQVAVVFKGRTVAVSIFQYFFAGSMLKA